MPDLRSISLFSGGGFEDVGARNAGLTPVLGVEYRVDIAEYYKRNIGDHCLVSKVEEVDWSGLGLSGIFHAHASPECKRASNATQQTEGEVDLAQSLGVCNMLNAITPMVFTLENVYGYRHFESFKRIQRTLTELGYVFDYWHLNAADFGVPQTRKRMVLVCHKKRA